LLYVKPLAAIETLLAEGAKTDGANTGECACEERSSGVTSNDARGGEVIQIAVALFMFFAGSAFAGPLHDAAHNGDLEFV
jgi:hypothetical protein